MDLHSHRPLRGATSKINRHTCFQDHFQNPCDLGCECGNQNQDVLLRRRSRATPARDSKRSGRRDYRRDLKALRIALRPLSMRPRMSEKAARSWRAERVRMARRAPDTLGRAHKAKRLRRFVSLGCLRINVPAWSPRQ